MTVADALSLAQMRIFLTVADAGSFSAAARRLRRAQSAISETIANLEAQLDVPLFDRSGRYPRLTAEGSVLLDDVRAIVAGVDDLRARAKGIAGGLEPELTAVMDVFLPLQRVAEVAKEFREVFPITPLRL
jgi:DNA-binding transcriptional LysR family regulator